MSRSETTVEIAANRYLAETDKWREAENMTATSCSRNRAKFLIDQPRQYAARIDRMESTFKRNTSIYICPRRFIHLVIRLSVRQLVLFHLFKLFLFSTRSSPRTIFASFTQYRRICEIPRSINSSDQSLALLPIVNCCSRDDFFSREILYTDAATYTTYTWTRAVFHYTNIAHGV